VQIRPLLIKIRLKCKVWAVKHRPRVKPASVEDFYRKNWQAAVPSDAYFCTRVAPRFFFGANARQEYAIALAKCFPINAQSILESANKIIEHRFDFLGSGETDLGENINWHRDFKSGFEWPLKHYSEIAIVDLSNNADVKVPWELSRMQFLTTLGRAYWLSNDVKYKDAFISILSRWNNHNPVDVGVNWTCSMEVAIRAINIIWGMYFFAGKTELPSDLVKEIIRSMYYHGLHIERNLEYIDSECNTNHLLANYLGLFYIGLMFPELGRAQKWLSIGMKGLEKEICLQVADDGADYECSLSYHRLVLEIFLSALVLGKTNEVGFSETFVERLTKMVAFSAAMTAHSGKVPSFGDNDDGFIVKLANTDPHDHRALLDVAAQLFDVKVADNVEKSEERLWYLGTNTLGRWPGMVRRKSRLFKTTGYAVIQNERMHLVFNACGTSEKALGGHKHNDLLSVNLEIDSVPFLIDAGTACYTSDYRLRNRSRSTTVHNTIAIDNTEQSRYLEKALFFMFRDAHPLIDLWTVTEDVIVVSGFHNGYSRLGNSIIHRRTLEVSLAKKAIDIWDEITGDGEKEHFIESNFLTPQDCHMSKNANGAQLVSKTGQSLMIDFTSSSELHLHTVPTDYYPTFGTVKKGCQLSCKCRTRLPFKLKTRMVHNSTGAQILSESVSLSQVSLSGKSEWQGAS